LSKDSRRPKTPTYLAFYVLFAPDTWRIVGGVIIALLLAPQIVRPDMSLAGRTMIYVMVAGIGWAVCGKPAQWIAAGLKKVILGKANR